MKNFIIFFLLAVLVSLGITFLLFTDKPSQPDSIQEQYTTTFATYGRNAAEMFSLYDVAGLKILQTYQVEGLSLLKQYSNSFQLLQPYMEIETVFQLFRQYREQFEDLLELFQPAVIADAHIQFGSEGLKYIIDDPEVYFLLQQYGESLVQLANSKGPIVFALVKRDQPEFIELYYDDVLFETISRFGVIGLMALKTYHGMANEVFRLFADDERLTYVLQVYGYQQVIPVLYYFYQTTPPITTLTQQIETFNVSQLFRQNEEDSETRLLPENTDPITLEHARFDRARWALQQIYERGNTFLRQFVISENGDVTLLQIVSVTNFFEELLFSDLRGSPIQMASSEKIEAGCEQLALALDVLGLLPYETPISHQTRCLYLRLGLPDARSAEDIQRLIVLDQHADLVEQYGEVVIPFVMQYGQDAIRILQQTDGEILQLASRYNEDLRRYILQYGIEVFELIRQYGEQVLEAIRQSDGIVIPYIKKYGNEIFPVLTRPEGKDLLLLCPVFGDEILQYATRYPGEFFRYLLKYGGLTVRAFREYDESALELAERYGDDMILYLGLYGNNALRLMESGQMGVMLLRVLPEERLASKEQNLFRYGLPGIYLSLFIRDPGRFHQYIGVLGETMFPVKPIYVQLLFWTLLVLIVLYVIRFIYKLVGSLFKRRS